ncbi:4-coumarate--CoA ligase family protein [Euzebya tangerina]|uniref:4-coumarate--CoA ligase family protein n=1 Tax=Euzebya tangerina TaxID=591198 RepID=UPI000E30C75E|nr:4-coumarate--CoA ligase family protein [Euzebya tangerina]
MSSQIIHKSPLPDVEIPVTALTPFILARADELGDKTALVDGPTGREVSYSQLASQIKSLAGGLVARGFGTGDVLAIMAPNVPEYAVVFHGVAMTGGAITTINPTYTADEVGHQLQNSGASIMVTVGMVAETAAAAAAQAGITDVYTLDQTEDYPSLSELMGEPLEEQVEVTPEEDVVVMPYSSGTTGLSKGVMLTHQNLVANVVQFSEPQGFTEDEAFVAVLPFFHIYGMQVLMNAGLNVGATIVTMPRFDLEQFLSLNDQYECTRAYVAPPIVVALAKHPLVDQFDLTNLQQIFSGAAPLSAEVGEEAGGRLGCEVVQGYGMTELSPVSHTTVPGDYKPGSVGVTVPNAESMIVDPSSGESLGVDERGELWVRGPLVMKGYFGNESATASTIDADGWLHTGDVAVIDSDGHVYIVDRLKELIKYKGFQVPPAELEALLLTHPAVADAAVIGLQDDEAGELPVGYVVLKDGEEASEDDIKAFVAEEVATYKQLHRITFMDEIPKSASGKILRRVLRDEAEPIS